MMHGGWLLCGIDVWSYLMSRSKCTLVTPWVKLTLVKAGDEKEARIVSYLTLDKTGFSVCICLAMQNIAVILI